MKWLHTAGHHNNSITMSSKAKPGTTRWICSVILPNHSLYSIFALKKYLFTTLVHMFDSFTKPCNADFNKLQVNPCTFASEGTQTDWPRATLADQSRAISPSSPRPVPLPGHTVSSDGVRRSTKPVTADAEVFLNLPTITHLHLLPATKERWEASVPAVIQSHYTALFSLHYGDISELIMEMVQLISLKIPASTHMQKKSFKL